MGPGRRRSGPGSSTRFAARTCRGTRRATWLHRVATAPIASSRPRHGGLPESWQLNLQARPKGRIVYVRRTDAVGTVEVLGRSFEVDRHG